MGAPDLVMVGQMPADRVRAGVQALPGQLLAQGNDQLRGLMPDRPRRRLRPPRQRLKGRLASPSARYRATSLLIQPWETS
jgi:hypothetical protein